MHVDPQLRLLTKVARLHHERGLRQVQIAEALGISQAKVSRLLKRAGELGIVRTVVTIAPGLHSELEDALEQRFGLAEAIIADVDEHADDAEVRSAIAAVAAAHLETTVGEGERIGIASWSQTLMAVADRVRPLSGRGAAEVVQLLGGMGEPEVQRQVHRLVDGLARALGASPVFVQAPGVVADRQTQRRLLDDPALAEVARRWRSLTMAVVGIGSIEPSELLAESGNAFSPDERRALLAEGAVGDICHRVFRRDGSLIAGPLDERTVSIAVDDFRAIPRRVGVAGGERKIEPMLGALAGGWVTTLVTDLRTAERLLET